MNNLPATVVSLPSLVAHPDRVWALLLGVNLGPLLWVTGALSTLLWQSTMARIGHPVSARRYAAVGWTVGVPALVGAFVIRLAMA
jgi:Na+/H+ antiporter NhaD/arsenite permease-like protein